MGVESGGRGGRVPAVGKSAGDIPPEMMILQHLFFLTPDIDENFAFSTILKIK